MTRAALRGFRSSSSRRTTGGVSMAAPPRPKTRREEHDRMSTLSRNASASTAGPSRTPKTTAGRLLAALTRVEGIDLARLAARTGIYETLLAECLNNDRRLSPTLQLRLAAMVEHIAPQHAALARRLFNQAEAAMYYERDGETTRHLTYPRSRFR
jgi:hypothetical protein